MYSIPWHKRQKDILDKYLENNWNNIPNWILFSWEEWIWKFEIWKDFAKKILSFVISEKIETQNNLLSNPNFISIWEIWFEWCDEKKISETTNFPQEHRKKAKVKSNAISIDDIHKIIEIAEKTSTWWKKVFLIKNIERMWHSAANAFLKTLEESKNSIFICTTENKNLLLPTIISRFQEIEFFKLSDSEIKKFLEEKNLELEEKLDEKILEEFTKFSFWKISLTKKFLKDKENFFEIKKIFEDWKNFLENISYPKIYQKSEFLFKNKGKIKDEIFFLENFLNSEWKKFFGEEDFMKIYENFLELKKWIKSNQNIKLVFDNFYNSILQ